MNVVVTGSRGYIGSALIERLKQLPINVVGEIDKKNNTDVLDINADDYKGIKEGLTLSLKNYKK